MGRRRKRKSTSPPSTASRPDRDCGACKGTGFVAEPVGQARTGPEGRRIEYRPALARCACWNRLQTSAAAAASPVPTIDNASRAAGEREES